jgi:4-diphosphocytidyl-2-C-methyl-D-erythritol kinase
LTGFQVVLLVPPVHIGTPEAYRKFDREGGVWGQLSEEDVRRYYRDLHASPWPFYNSFSRTLVSSYPEIREALDIFEPWNPLYRGISGSGSSVFAVFSKDFSVEAPIKEIKSRFDRVWKIKLLARWKSPY